MNFKTFETKVFNAFIPNWLFLKISLIKYINLFFKRFSHTASEMIKDKISII